MLSENGCKGMAFYQIGHLKKGINLPVCPHNDDIYQICPLSAHSSFMLSRLTDNHFPTAMEVDAGA